AARNARPIQAHQGRPPRPTRREVLSGAGASVLALSPRAALARPPELASGTVFHDRGGRGHRQRGDPGVAGVMVSNGRDVVRTDTEGRWRIPVRAGDCLFVVEPPHWSTPVGAGGVPRFSLLHQPLGSPCDIAYRHAGIAPTGALPATIDFPLIPTPERSRFDVLLLADTQPADGAELAYLRDDIVAGTLGRGAAFGINHGDVVFDDLSLYPRYLQV